VIYSFYVLFELKKVDRTSLDILGGWKQKTEPFFWNFSYAQNFLWKQFGKKNELKNSFGILGSVFSFQDRVDLTGGEKIDQMGRRYSNKQ
jgi:hypothetical protein